MTKSDDVLNQLKYFKNMMPSRNEEVMLCTGVERVGGKNSIQETISNNEIKTAINKLKMENFLE